jgi:hypothetical protein
MIWKLALSTGALRPYIKLPRPVEHSLSLGKVSMDEAVDEQVAPAEAGSRMMDGSLKVGWKEKLTVGLLESAPVV